MSPEDAELAVDGTPPARSGAPRISGRSYVRVSRRGAAVDRVGLALPPADAAAGHPTGTELRIDGGIARVGARGRRARRHPHRSRRSVLQPAGTTKLSEGRHGRGRADFAARDPTRSRLPEVGFTLSSGARVLLEAPPAGSLEERFYQIYGERPDLVPVEAGRGHLRVRFHRRARRAGTGARASARVRQSAHRPRPDDRARDSAGVQRRDDQGTQPGSAPVHRAGAGSRGRERASDQG